MIIYGVGILAFCYVVGQIFGEFIGKLIGVNANVGGVGFAMILLIFINDWLKKKNYLDISTEKGITFWSQMYIPIVVAMSAIQNVKVAVSSGFIAILAGIVPVLICLVAIPFLSKLSKNTPLN
ncbi:malonate transporter subunit MadL [Arcicella sp. DC2W]|uniref:Malonate transporter subunit MadL n=1 Tax=Arcicella gelida TaxID=2984195 RepID=A0ABU5SBI4_9BACT|nr:malonate transporter subunit MadL [Arcicella sp. DC2W]MEA5405823.1 malonate transporter subunit MadL [Arcicella sp. DC2W]